MARDLRHALREPRGSLHLGAPLCQEHTDGFMPQEVAAANGELWDPKLVPFQKHKSVYIYITVPNSDLEFANLEKQDFHSLSLLGLSHPRACLSFPSPTLSARCFIDVLGTRHHLFWIM